MALEGFTTEHTPLSKPPRPQVSGILSLLCLPLLLRSGTFLNQIAIKDLHSFQIPGTSSVVQRKWKALQPLSQPRGPGQQTKSRISAVAAEEKQIRARRKTARMLMVVLLVFAICYLPISILNVLKR